MKKSTGNTRQTTGVALLIALIVVLQSVSALLTKFGLFSISLVLVPIVIGAAVYGPKVGAVLGGAFAAITYIFCVTGLDAGGQMVFQASPALCLLVVAAKSLLAGWLSGLTFSVLKGKSTLAAMFCAAVVCVLVNTGTFLLGLWLLFPGVLSAWSEGGNVFLYMLSGIVLTNMVPELIINVVFSSAAERIYRVVKK